MLIGSNIRRIHNSRNNRNSIPSGSNPMIDEFRLREQQKEEEFSKNNSNATTSDTEKESSEEDEKLNIIRVRILESSLAFVNEYGWTRDSISYGAEKIGYPGVVHGIFPDGSIELINYFYRKCNSELCEIMKHDIETLDGDSTTKIPKNPVEFLCRSVQKRLEMMLPYKKHWPEALAQMTLPHNVPKTLAQLLTLIDDICYYSGDRSVDFGWYTRRVGLAMIYKLTELHLLQDSSVNHEKTWEFLRNRLSEATTLEQFLEEIGGSSSGGSNNSQKKLTAMFETARNMLGLNYDRR